MRWDAKIQEQTLLLVALALAMGQLGCRPAPGGPGLKWTKRKTTGIDLSAIAWSGSHFVAVGCCSVLTSPDGVTWKVAVADEGVGANQAGVRPMPDGWALESITWGASQFVAVGYVAERPNRPRRALIVTSPDGVTWTERSPPASANRLRDILWSGDRYVAVGDGILTSPDGVTWSAQQTPVSVSLDAVTWGGSQFIAVGWKSVVTSPDGVTWTERSAPAENLYDVAWSGERFVAVAGVTILTSPDGVSWSTQSTPVRGSWRAVIWAGSQFVAVGGPIMTSPDGLTWTQRPAPKGSFFDIAWSGTRFVAVGWLLRGWFADYTTALIVTSP